MAVVRVNRQSLEILGPIVTDERIEIFTGLLIRQP